MGMDTTGTVPVRACTAAACDGLVISETLDLFLAGHVSTETESEVIAITLAGGTSLESFKYHIRYSLACENIASHHGRMIRRRKQRFRRYLHVDGLEAALVKRNVF